jgi:hypothetical protein
MILYRKSLVVGIICLFLGVAVAPSFTANEKVDAIEESSSSPHLNYKETLKSQLKYFNIFRSVVRSRDNYDDCGCGREFNSNDRPICTVLWAIMSVVLTLVNLHEVLLF